MIFTDLPALIASGSFVTPEVVLSGPDVRVETRDAEKETELWEVGSPPFNRGNITRPSAGFHSPVQACRCSGQEPSSVCVQLGLAKLRGQMAAVPNWWGQHLCASCSRCTFTVCRQPVFTPCGHLGMSSAGTDLGTCEEKGRGGGYAPTLQALSFK